MTMHFESRLTRISQPSNFGALFNGERFILNRTPEVAAIVFTKTNCKSAQTLDGKQFIPLPADAAVTIVDAN